MKKKLFVSVAGTLGVGKTTFVQFISKEFGFYKIEENFKANPFLKKFYGDKKRWAFSSEMFFLVEKVKQTLSILPLYQKKPVILDVPIYEDVFAYGGALLQEGSMSKGEWQVYMDAFKEYEKFLIKPDVIIFLTAPVEVMYDRIVARGRSFEIKVGRKKLIRYLQLLEALNKRWIKSYSKYIKIVQLDISDLDYIHDKKIRAELKLKIRRLLYE